MQDDKKRDFLINTARRLLIEAEIPILNVYGLQDHLDWAAKKGKDHIVLAVLFLIRGSKIKADGIMTAADKLTIEEGFSPAFAAVCRAIDQIPLGS